jgi:hypothetical protein
MYVTPKAKWAKALYGARDTALIAAASAAAKRAVGTSVKKLAAIEASTSAAPHNASTFPGSSAKHAQKNPARVTSILVLSPCLGSTGDVS